ncbi:unnamed protein product [Auanema sp. JU1783]|nr:unnamed protein product [Auanema sp. JU1783]
MSEPDSGYPTPRDDIIDNNLDQDIELTPIKEQRLPASSTPYAGSSIRNLNDVFQEGLTPIRRTHEEKRSTEEAKKLIELVRHKKRMMETDQNVKEQLSRIEELVNEKSRTIESLENQLDSLNQEKECMHDKLNESQQVIAVTNVNLEANSTELEEIRKHLHQTIKEINELKLENIEKTSEIALLKRVIGAREEEMTKMESKNSNLENEVQQLRNCETLLAESEKKVETVRQEYLSHEAKLRKESEESLFLLKKQIADLNTERDDLIEGREKSSKTLLDNRQREIQFLEENEELRRQLASTDDKYEKLSQEYRLLRSRESDLRAARERMDGRLSEVLKSQEDLEDLKKKMTRLEKKNSDLEATLKQKDSSINELEEKVKGYAKKVSIIAEDLRRMSEKNKDLQGMNDELIGTNIEQKTKVSELSGKLGTVEKAIKETQEELRKSQMENEKLAHDLSEVTGEKKIMADKCGRLQELEGINTKLSTELAYLRKEVECQKSPEEFETIVTQLACSEEQNRKLQEDIIQLRLREDEVRLGLTQVDSLKFELKGRENELKKQEEQLVKLENDLVAIKHERDMMIHERIALVNEFEAVREAHESEKSKLLEDIETLNSRLIQLEALDGYPGQMSFDAMNRTVWDVVPKQVRGVLENLKKDSAEIRSIVDKMQKINVDVSDKYGSIHSLNAEQFSRPQSRAGSSTSTLVGRNIKLFDELIQSMNDIDLTNCEDGTSQIRGFVIKFLRSVAFETETNEKSILQLLESTSRELERRSQHLKKDMVLLREQLSEVKAEHREAISNLNDQRVHVAASEEHIRLLRKDIDTRDKRIMEYSNERDKLTFKQRELERDAMERTEEMRKMNNLQRELIIEVEAFVLERETISMELKKREDALIKALADIEDLHRRLILTEDSLSECTTNLESRNATITSLEAHIKNINRKMQHELRTKKYNQETMEMCIKLYEQEEEYVKRLRRRNAERQQVIDEILSGKEMGEKTKRKLNRFQQEERNDSEDERKHHDAWTIVALAIMKRLVLAPTMDFEKPEGLSRRGA